MPVKAMTQGAGLFRHFSITAFGAVLGIVITLALSPVLSRIYSPNDFGVWALFMSLAFAVPVMAGLRYEIAVVLPRVEANARHVARLVVIVAVAFSGFVLVLAPALAWIPTPPWNLPFDLFWLMAPMTLATGLFQAQIALCQRDHRFGRIALARLILAVATGGAQIGAGFVITGGTGLVIGTVIGQILVTCWLLIGEDTRWLFHHWNRRRLVAAAKYWKKLPLYTAPYTLQGQLHRQLIVILIGGYGGTALVGYYSLASRCVYYPLTILSQSLGQVFFPRMAQIPKLADLGPFVGRTLLVMTFLLAPICALGSVFAAPVLTIVFGHEWSAAAPVASAMIYPSVFLVMGAWFERIFDITGRQRLHIIFETSCNILILAAFWYALLMFNGGPAAIVILAIGLSLYYIAWIVVAFSIAGFPLAALGRALLLFAILWAGWFASGITIDAMLDGWAVVGLITVLCTAWYACGAWKFLTILRSL